MASVESTAIFRRNWSLYDLIAEHNYMHHREIYGRIAELLKQHRASGRYGVLDLGCGNARFLSSCLTQTPPARYQGVDMSEAALAEAREYLAPLPGPVTLRHGDMLEAVETTGEAWDVVFTGFALHHLAPGEKARFFRAAGGCLAEDGVLLMVDVVREEDQSRETYLATYLRDMRHRWTAIPRTELESACEHVATHDYPETISALNAMAAAAGLTHSAVLSRFGPHCSVGYSRSNFQVGD